MAEVKTEAMTELRVGIIGLGFVGGAMMESFTEKGLGLGKNLFVYDKYKEGGVGSFEEVTNTDIVFLVLPTKYNAVTHEYDKTAIYKTSEKLARLHYRGIVVIKSTVEPQTTKRLYDKYKLNYIHNPEFLTARRAKKDFHNQKRIYIGTSKDMSKNKLIDFYKYYYPNAEIIIAESIETELFKMTENSFGAIKVQFFNEIYMLSKKLGVNYDRVRDLLVSNEQVCRTHTNVPGPDGRLSYGGYCFPKDTNALLSIMKNNDISHEVLKATIKERNIMRDDNDNIIK